MHTVNHPAARHFTTDVFEGDPGTECAGRPVGWFHMSPDCTHFTQASAGQPRKREIRSLSWIGLAPAPTITTKDRLAMVTVMVKGTTYVIVDICLRMLKPSEPYKAQGFHADSIISHGADGRPFTKTLQVHMCGNSVSPPPMAALARATDPWRAAERQSEAA